MMFCGHCGTKMEKVERFCPECGKEQLQESPLLPEQQPEGFAISHGEPPSQELNEEGTNKVAIGIIASICAGLVLLIGLGLFLIFGSRDVEVPDLSNLTKEEAIQRIEESRLSVGDITEEYSGRVAEGLVISQSPLPGIEVERRTTINLTISLGAKLVEVPDFTDTYLLDAADIIRELGLTLVVVEEYSETIEDGMVISQSIPAGDMVEMGDSIDLVVSIGSEFVTVPDFTGLTEDEAVGLVQSSHLTLGTVEGDYHEHLEEGLVIGQSLRSGTLADRGDSVDLVISLGPPPIPVTPFDLDVWDENYIIHLELDGVMVSVPLPPWLNDVLYTSLFDDDFVFEDGVFGFVSSFSSFYVVNRERDDLMTMIEVALMRYTGDFEDAAEGEAVHIENFLSSLEYNHSVSATVFYQGDGELTVGLSILEYARDGSGELISVFELLKINEYNGLMIRTRLRLRTVDASADMCSDEFADAFGLWRYIDGGFIRMDP